MTVNGSGEMRPLLLTVPLQIPHEDLPAKKLRLSKPSKSAALHIDLCKATNSTDALQYLLQFARKPVEAESVEGVIRILLEHYYKVGTCRGAVRSPDAPSQVVTQHPRPLPGVRQLGETEDRFSAGTAVQDAGLQS